jgi:hypothetical protein
MQNMTENTSELAVEGRYCVPDARSLQSLLQNIHPGASFKATVSWDI